MAVSFGQRRALGKRYAIDPAYLLEAQRLDQEIAQQPTYAALAERQREFDIAQKNQKDAQEEAGKGEMVSSLSSVATLPMLMYGGKAAKAIFGGTTATTATTPAITGAAPGVSASAPALTSGAGSVMTGSTPVFTSTASTTGSALAADASLTAGAEGAASAGAGAASGASAAALGPAAAGVGGGLLGAKLGQSIGNKLGIGGVKEQSAVGGAVGGAAAGGVAAGIAAGMGYGSVGGPVGALIGGVIGGVVGLVSCFIAGTPIEMEDGSVKPVECIDTMDRTAAGGTVTGIGKILSDDIYSYCGISVAGSHAVCEDGVWLRVRDSEKAEKVDLGTVPVYAINNINHRLLINGITFADYGEVTDSDDWTQQERLDFLNGVTSGFSEIQCESALSAAC